MRNASAVSFLLAHRIDVNQKLCRLHYFTTFETAIMVAAKQADCEIAEILLSQQSVDLDGYHPFDGSGVMLKAAVSGRRRITEMMFDAGAPLVPTGREKARTPFQVACELHFPDPFWFYAMHGLARFGENRGEPPKPESPPIWVLDSLSRIRPGNEVIAMLEVSLLELVFPGTQQKPLHVKELCQRCEVLPSEIRRTREERLAKWKGDALSFNYGFIKRCEMCRVALMEYSLLPGEFKRARVIDRNAERYNYEDDLTCLQKLLLCHPTAKMNQFVKIWSPLFNATCKNANSKPNYPPLHPKRALPVSLFGSVVLAGATADSDELVAFLTCLPLFEDRLSMRELVRLLLFRNARRLFSLILVSSASTRSRARSRCSFSSA